MEKLEITPATIIPADEAISKYDLEQKPLLQLPDNSRAVMAVNKLMDRLLSRTTVVR
jgi:CO dehydrogenase nickel-insertion accessory protein CooC1